MTVRDVCLTHEADHRSDNAGAGHYLHSVSPPRHSFPDLHRYPGLPPASLMSSPNRPSQQADAQRRRARLSRERRYQAVGARYACPECPLVLPTQRGRSVHLASRHVPKALP